MNKILQWLSFDKEKPLTIQDLVLCMVGAVLGYAIVLLIVVAFG